MIRAVLDANVFVSGVVGSRRSESVPGELLRHWRAGSFLLVTSPTLTSEILRTLTKPYFMAAVSDDERADARTALIEYAFSCSAEPPVERIASHPEDDLILATAVAGRADVLVTGDKQLLLLREHQDVRILTARAFLAMLPERRLEIVE